MLRKWLNDGAVGPAAVQPGGLQPGCSREKGRGKGKEGEKHYISSAFILKNFPGAAPPDPLLGGLIAPPDPPPGGNNPWSPFLDISSPPIVEPAVARGAGRETGEGGGG